ncbi:MAG TPA: riboflavin synthase [Chitinophagales bacterium]|nr:riboflavin synthase [Chitinophagales bacterium]
MFTGIIETIGTIVNKQEEDQNVHLTVESSITQELKIDQSIAHNGVCLTVVSIDEETSTYQVTAIKETLDITNLHHLEIGDAVNLERAMLASARLDGHMVQGHVDTTAEIKKIVDVDGSTEFHFKFLNTPEFYLVDKGSVCIDGVSLTVVKAKKKKFHVAIIPYTLEHTIFHQYLKGDIVNIEFDIIGKYIQQYLKK